MRNGPDNIRCEIQNGMFIYLFIFIYFTQQQTQSFVGEQGPTSSQRLNESGPLVWKQVIYKYQLGLLSWTSMGRFIVVDINHLKKGFFSGLGLDPIPPLASKRPLKNRKVDWRRPLTTYPVIYSHLKP